MAEVVWLSAAKDQLVQIAAYLHQLNPRAAEDIAVRLNALAESLSYLPDRGRPTTSGARELTSISPYIIRYRVSADRTAVTILSVRHSRRRPT